MIADRACCHLAALTLLLAIPARAQRVPLPPRLQAGQTLVYQLETSGSRSTRVESRVTGPQSPPHESLAASCLLQVNVAHADRDGFRLKTYLSERLAGKSGPDSSAAGAALPDKLVEVFVDSNGAASDLKGLDELTPAERYAWTAWLGRFTSSMAWPPEGLRPGRRWRSAENETSPSPIAELAWQRKYEYVKEESCTPGRSGPASGKSGGPPNESCAVIFVHAILRQKSSPRNSTPDEYKRRGLTTRGTAAGTNETVLYVSTKTGILVRASEEVQQSMDVTVALGDGSNQVRYAITANSRSRIELLPDGPQEVR